ncbi:MAG: RelA/SpoT domain-containing protein [Candidatus Gracilibacteria bacterium]|nr:RelA/SpoT domain-containing protein [Candidatus Gracilibacteria bacterium]
MLTSFKVKNILINRKLQKIIKKYNCVLNEVEREIIETMFLKLKRYSDDSYYLYFIIIYGLFFLKKIGLDNDVVSSKDRKNIKTLQLLFDYENFQKFEDFIDLMLKIDNNLFLIKLIIKHTVLSNERKDLAVVIKNSKKYYGSLGYLYIPILAYKNYTKLESFFQDFYFKEIYSKEYEETKKEYDILFEGKEIGEDIMIDLTNELNELNKKLKIYGNLTIRKKSYFSLYNKKIRRPSNYKIKDFIGVRVVFKNNKDFTKFIKGFEDEFIIDLKKDYVKNPKENGYQSIHYNFMYMYNNIKIPVEIQIRTRKMDEEVSNNPAINYFNYTTKENKYGPIFKEIQKGLAIIKQKIEENPNIIKKI